ncbi:hypothetical protein MPER_04721, partial [Moniliophthora perniciosa FA553]
LENLFLRYEEPSSMIWEAVTSGNIKPPNSGTQAVVKAPTDALLTLEKTTLLIITAIMSEQSQRQTPGGQLVLPLSSTFRLQVTLPFRNLTLSELQRCKRQFVTVHKKAITLGTTEKGEVDWGEERVAEKFVSYLEENLSMNVHPEI